MRLFLSAALIVVLFYSPCMAFDEETSKPPQAIKRIESFTKRLSHAMTEVPRQVVPIVKAVEDELSMELHSDWPRIREELSSQMRRLLPTTNWSSTPPPSMAGPGVRPHDEFH